jgi:heavy metal translocating P-type ATPase
MLRFLHKLCAGDQAMTASKTDAIRGDLPVGLPEVSDRPGGANERRGPRLLRAHGVLLLLVTLVLLLAGGGVLHLVGAAQAAHSMWIAATCCGMAASGWWVAEAARRHQLGADVIALLALAGTLIVGEYLAGAVIAVMLASGRALEAWAAGRSERQLRLLLDRAPRIAHRKCGSAVVDVALDEVHLADLLVVKPGEVVPVDGRLEGAVAVLDESALTGEPVPVERYAGDAVRSGSVNGGGPFELRVTTTAADSTYAGIVRMVSAAQAQTSPSVRLADRYAGVFLAASLLLATVSWAVTGELSRAVAVLVVATPCPLILAVPVALISGLSRAAQRGVVIKGGAVLERLAKTVVVLCDKTGTLTAGRPTVTDIVVGGDLSADELLRLAASVDQVSPHVLAASVVREAHARGLTIGLPADVDEVHGQGVRGSVAGRRVAVGKASWVAEGIEPAWLRTARRRADREGLLSVFVAVDGVPAGVLLLDDPVRPDAARTIRRLRRDGIRRIVMVTGDRGEVAETVGAVVGVDEVLAERTPAEKVEAVEFERRHAPTAFVGDGINDAPALALADVGVAIGARGATASSEAADVVLMEDRLDRLGEAIVIARRARTIAAQSVAGGIGLSLVAMLMAAFGLLPPTWGAMLQELIDVAAITNAMRVLAVGSAAVRLTEDDAELARRFSAEHAALATDVEQLRRAADAIGVLPDEQAIQTAKEAYELLVTEVGPHERAEEEQLYPAVARVIGGSDPTGPMSRAHIEIAHLIRRIGALLPPGPNATLDADDLAELRRLLYGLHAILRLHNAQEEESYLSLADDSSAPASRGAENWR